MKVYRVDLYSPLKLIARCFLFLSAIASLLPSARSQSILSDELPVAKELQPLDVLIRNQLKELFDQRDAAEAAHGRDSAKWFEAAERYDPMTVHGASLLQFAREHPGTDEALAC